MSGDYEQQKNTRRGWNDVPSLRGSRNVTFRPLAFRARFLAQEEALVKILHEHLV